jgi:nucleotide-binding universal stress UspA family protein
MGPLVVGYDGTPGARAALTEADRLAAELDTGIVVVFCAPVSRIGGEVRDYEEAVREHGRAQLEEARAALSGEPELLLLERPPAEGLVEVAEDRDARLIVVGCYGERPLKSALVGSTPTRLLHLSERPVLAVRSAEPRPS